MSNFNFKVRRGNTVPITVVITVDGAPYDLTGCTLFFTGKTDLSQADDDALFEKETGNGITHINIPEGRAKIVLPAAETYDAPIDETIYCDIQLKTADGEIYTVASGKLTFLEDVTRRTV